MKSLLVRAGRRAWRGLVGRDRAGEEDWVHAVREADSAFDAAHGVQSGGIVPLRDLDIVGSNRQFGVDHVATLPDEFEAAFAALGVQAHGFSFVDLGCGKGRALLLAARHPFKRLVGVEFAPTLLEAARKNTRRLKLPVSLHCMDAASYVLPAGPVVLYLYNPFRGAVMQQVAQRAAEAAGPVRVMYLNPFEKAVWLDAGFREVATGATFSILAK